MKVDYLIIGQGLAGSILAYHLIKKNKKVVVADKYNPTSSSFTAAGLVNPIVFKELKKSWNLDLFLPFMKDFYSEIEQELGGKVFFENPLHKIIANEEEKIFWKKKASDIEIGKFISKEIVDIYPETINSGTGIGMVYGGGFLDTGKFLPLFRNYLLKKESLREDDFIFEDLKIKNDYIKWKDITAEKIIFSEGAKAQKNPFFAYLPFNVTKGEVISIKAEKLKAANVIYKGIFILPQGNDNYKVGATYKWDNINEIPSEAGKNELTTKLDKILNVPYQVIGQKAAVRPNTQDRRPFIGQHPDYRNVYIFNGLGSKGVLMAPFLAANFADALEDRSKKILEEADIKRFRK